jgi:endonuclease/exonuclease/phosphatase family metal-dependent hydrolase
MPPGQASPQEISQVAMLADQLNGLGLKYNHVTDWSQTDGPYPESGLAVLTQLPIIGSAARFVPNPDGLDQPQTRQVVAVRLGVSPEVNIDVYSVCLSSVGEGPDDQAAQLLQFVDDSAGMFVPEPEPAPRRRGRPPRVSPAAKRAEPVRMVFLAGCFADSPDREAERLFGAAGYSNGSREVPPAPTPTGGGQTGPASTDAVYLRPGLRPTDAARVFTDGTLPGGRTGIFLGFEV